MRKMIALALASAALVTVPTAANARWHNGYYNNGYYHHYGYGYRYGYPRSTTVISVGYPGYGYYGGGYYGGGYYRPYYGPGCR